MNQHLAFLLSSIYDTASLHPEHTADLAKSGLTQQMIALQKIRTVPPNMIDALLGFHASKVKHSYIIPFADPRGGWMDHVRLKVFGEDEPAEVRGDYVEEHQERWRYNSGRTKYLVRRRSEPRLFFPLATMGAALHGPDALWIVEGPKKSLAVVQLGLPAVAIESAWGWHVKGSRELLADFDTIAMKGRTLKVAPDPDAQRNPEIARATHHLAEALERRGGRVQIVVLPIEVAA
ncbi:MAG: DUF3854 domain-containing protein [Candidatus Rokuibacteriota bacterium]